MGISFTRNHSRLYRYYLCANASKEGYEACPVRCLPAAEAEGIVLRQLRGIFTSPDIGPGGRERETPTNRGRNPRGPPRVPSGRLAREPV